MHRLAATNVVNLHFSGTFLQQGQFAGQSLVGDIVYDLDAQQLPITSHNGFHPFPAPVSFVFAIGDIVYAPTMMSSSTDAYSGVDKWLNAQTDDGMRVSLSATVNTNYDLQLQPEDLIASSPTDSPPDFGFSVYSNSANAGFAPISSYAFSPVVEPAGWATMILGFAIIGAAMRRHPQRKAHFRLLPGG